MGGSEGLQGLNVADPLPITLYIPCYNGARFLDRVLPAVLTQTYPISEIMVVDDGSTDRSAETAERHGVRVIRHETNRGLGATRNTAVRAARTDFVAALDADVVARPEWLAYLVENLASGEFGAASGNLIETVDRTVADRWRAVHMQQGWGEERMIDPDFLFGNNGLYEKRALLDAGLYDEACRTNGEDVKMGESLKENGVSSVYDPRAVCDHLREDDVHSICRTYWKWVFFDQEASDWASLRYTGKQARNTLLKRFRRADLAARRFDLAWLDTRMYYEWRLHDWKRFLGRVR